MSSSNRIGDGISTGIGQILTGSASSRERRHHLAVEVGDRPRRERAACATRRRTSGRRADGRRSRTPS